MGVARADIAPFTPRRRRIYRLINLSSAPVWLSMICFPRARTTRWLVARTPSLFITLGAAYDALLVTGIVRQRELTDYRDPAAVLAAINTPDIFLAGWAHYITFDLFVGRWIWCDAVQTGRSARLPLLLTWLTGPAGLSLYLVTRRPTGHANAARRGWPHRAAA